MVNALSLSAAGDGPIFKPLFVNVQDGGETMSQSSYWSIAPFI